MDDLPDSAVLRVIPCHPPLAVDAADALTTAITKLFQQFVREQRIGQVSVTAAAGNGLILIAYTEEGEGLSGCRKDMLAKILADHEQRTGSQLLAPPPIVRDDNATAKCQRMGEFRSQVQVGAVTMDSLVWDHLCDSLGAWRQGMPRKVRDVSWLAQSVQRIGAK